MLNNLGRCNQQKLKHQKLIVIAQIIAFGNFENDGSIQSMVKSISLFNYQNFPRILLLGDLIINFNLNINALRFLRNGKVSQCIKLMGDIFKSISLKKILKLIVFKKNIVLKLTTSIQCMNLNRRRLVLTIHVLCFLFAGER